jgi:hypothetical protein
MHCKTHFRIAYRITACTSVEGKGTGEKLKNSEKEPASPLQRSPGQMKHDTPWWLEHVPERFCEQLNVPSLHRAVAVPHAADAGAQRLGGAGVGVGAFDFWSPTDTFRLPESVTICCAVSNSALEVAMVKVPDSSAANEKRPALSLTTAAPTFDPLLISTRADWTAKLPGFSKTVPDKANVGGGAGSAGMFSVTVAVPTFRESSVKFTVTKTVLAKMEPLSSVATRRFEGAVLFASTRFEASDIGLS